MQVVKTIIRPCPCQTRKSRIHLRVCGARRDGKGRRAGGGGGGCGSAETTSPRSRYLCRLSRFSNSKDDRFSKTGSGLRTRTMTRCPDPTALPLGVFCMILSLWVREQYSPPRPPPPPPTRGKRNKKGKSLWQPHLERDMHCEGFEYSDVQKQAPISRLT